MLNILSRTRGGGARAIAPDEAVRRAAAGELTLIDVRDGAEVAQTGKAEGALHIPLMLLQYRADPRHPEFHPGLDPARPVALYCASGARSGMAAGILAAHSFAEVYNLGGLSHWAAGGGRIAAG
jgi:rhodanese-related sulfurtransferase